MTTLARLIKILAAAGVAASLLAACAPGRPYVPTVDDENRLLYAPEPGF
ncbi:MAG: hypothetical protein AB7G15_15725 [Alphaproteobacteria bacterium]